MRKFLKIAFFIFTAVYLLRRELGADIKGPEEFWITTAYFAFLLPYAIYEIIQLRKDDKANNTHVIRNRMFWIIIGVIIIILGKMYINSRY